ncbi:MAG: hypothetical protein NT023_18430 [Armatimonadetes bacterium]|nr:hypothetical protein [Armatimonadota bacterium]
MSGKNGTIFTRLPTVNVITPRPVPTFLGYTVAQPDAHQRESELRVVYAISLLYR